MILYSGRSGFWTAGGILMCLLKVYGGISVVWTGQLTGWSMNLFFTAVGIGFTAELLRKGGKLCVQIAIASVILITLQNIVGVAIAKMTGVNPLIGIACGSAAMYGGVGTAGAFGLFLNGWAVMALRSLA